jgi:heme oxygenase
MTASTSSSVETIPFAERLRAATRDTHGSAEGTGFMSALLSGRLSPTAAASLSGQLFHVYGALERPWQRLSGDPVAGPFLDDRLLRLPALAADLDYLLGASWRTQIDPLPVTAEYTQRITELARTWPAGYVAHHYTRYLGDLSGGQVIGRRMAELLGEPERGTRFYRFAEIPQPKRFKDEYRRLLDAAPWDADESDRVIDEVRVAYDLNTRLLRDLATKAGLDVDLTGLDATAGTAS